MLMRTCSLIVLMPGRNIVENSTNEHGMIDEIREAFVSSHNYYRSLVARGEAQDPLVSNGYAPKAARVLKMIYDRDIENVAMKHSLKCEFKHST
ncbi:hypothetical protein Q1695_007375 [Nippostrongylus brasiliensis]|nr:hypothetical protein Q1695_007375 [Nippostrongylus brasiliensis]